MARPRPLARARSWWNAPKAVEHRALTAAAKRVEPEVDKAGTAPSKAADWQRRAWDDYEQVGELWFSSNFVGSCCSRVSLGVGQVDDDGNVSPVFGEKVRDEATGEERPEILHPLAEDAARLVRELRSPIGGQAHLLRMGGINLSVAGECYLLGLPEPTELSGTKWEIVSVEEVRSGHGTYPGTDRPVMLRVQGRTGRPEELPEDHDLIRIWRPHPRWSNMADASTRPLLDILDELVILTKGVRATTLSRLSAAGILWLNDEIDAPPESDAAEGTEEADPFVTDLTVAMTTPISDRGSAAAVVPMVARVPAHLLANKAHADYMDFSKGFDTFPAVELRKEAVQRVAQGVDLPMEIVTGQGATNHWNAWAIDENAYKSHIEPLVELFVDGLTTGYLRPYLLGMSPAPPREEVARLVITVDVTELVAHPNRGSDAKDLHDRLVISDRVLREATGFSEDDAPDEEEITRRLELARAKAARPVGERAEPARAEEVEPGPPAPAEQAALAREFAAAAEVAVEAAIARVGSKLRSKVQGHPQWRDMVGTTPYHEIAATLGPTAVESLIAPAELFRGAFQPLQRVVVRRAAELGVDDPSTVCSRVLAAADRLAYARLYHPKTEIRPEDFADALAATNGHRPAA